MKKLNICWPVVLAIALACTLTTCSNDQARREYEHEQSRPKIEVPSTEEFFMGILRISPIRVFFFASSSSASTENSSEKQIVALLSSLKSKVTTSPSFNRFVSSH